MTETRSPAPAPPAIRLVARAFLLAIGLGCLALTVFLLTLADGRALIDDTRAWLGAGEDAASDPSVPVVHGVSCRKEWRSLRSTDRSGSLLSWDCDVQLVAAGSARAPKDDPFAGRSHSDGMAEWNRRLKLELDRIRSRSRFGSVDRNLPSDRSSDGESSAPGDLPKLRRLSAGTKSADNPGGEPPRYGVVWGFGELLLRWLAWLLPVPLMLFVVGGVLVRFAWNRPRK